MVGISSSLYMTRKITVVPRNEVVNYRFLWLSSNLPSGFDKRDLRTMIYKTDKTPLNMLKAAKNAYAGKHLDHTPTKSKSRSPVSSVTSTPPGRVSKQRLTGVCMSPLLDPLDLNQPPPNDLDHAYAED